MGTGVRGVLTSRSTRAKGCKGAVCTVGAALRKRPCGQAVSLSWAQVRVGVEESSRERDFYPLEGRKGHSPSFGGFEVTEADRSTDNDFTFPPLFKSKLVKSSNTLHQEEPAIQSPLSRPGLEAAGRACQDPGAAPLRSAGLLASDGAGTGGGAL